MDCGFLIRCVAETCRPCCRWLLWSISWKEQWRCHSDRPTSPSLSGCLV